MAEEEQMEVVVVAQAAAVPMAMREVVMEVEMGSAGC